MRVAFTIAILAAAAASLARAHEIGTSRVTAVFNGDRTFSVEIVTDATNLAEKLEAAAGRPPQPETDPARLTAILESNQAALRRRITLRFDGVDADARLEFNVTPAPSADSAPAATIRLAGHVPNGARLFKWSYGWTYTTYPMTIRGDGFPNARTLWLEGAQTSPPLDLSSMPPRTRLDLIWQYLVLGFTHIVPLGLDHMLFVLGLYLLNNKPRAIIAQVSAFTLAHSITLGLSMYGLLNLSPRFVEPVIAISIAYVAIENLFLKGLKPWRIVLVFVFGLLHGMGFAGVLREVGIPREDFLTALLTFNVGVEFGQLAVIGGAFLLVGWHAAKQSWYRGRVVVPASVAIACSAIYWTVERITL